MAIPSGIPRVFHIYVIDLAEAPVEGLVQTDFDIHVSQGGVARSVPVIVSEVGSGYYACTFTPPVGYAGHWLITLAVSEYTFVWDEAFDVVDLETVGVQEHLTVSANEAARLILYTGSPVDIELTAVRKKENLNEIPIFDEFGGGLTPPVPLVAVPAVDGFYWTEPLLFADAGEMFFIFETSGGQRLVRDGTIYAPGIIPDDEIEPPSSIELCGVYGWLLDGLGIPIEGAECRFDTIPIEGTEFVVGETTTIVYTDENGFFQVDLLRKTVVVVTIHRANIHRPIYVPDRPTAELTTL